jgi:hypothetical protein
MTTKADLRFASDQTTERPKTFTEKSVLGALRLSACVRSDSSATQVMKRTNREATLLLLLMTHDPLPNFPRPWRIRKSGVHYRIEDGSGRLLAFVYSNGDRPGTEYLPPDEALEMAMAIARMSKEE